MKCLLFLVATAIVCQIAASSTIRRRRGYSDQSPDHSIIISTSEDPFIHPPWWHPEETKPLNPDPPPFDPFGSFDVGREGFDDSSSSSEEEIASIASSKRVPGYGGPIWWKPSPGSSSNYPVQPPNESNRREQILSCIRSCPVTAEYNPVCGSNNVTYPNPGRLDCEQRCGINVVLSRLTACSVPPDQTGEVPSQENVASCMRSCPVTGEYNPVCGSNNVTYSNPGRLECAQYCGVEVALVKKSSCDVAEPTTTTENGVAFDFSALCIKSCPVTSEYNPVCGSNGITYGNSGRLECAQTCGVVVTLVRHTSCEAPITEEEYQNNANNGAITEINPVPTTTSTIAPPHVNNNGDSNFNDGIESGDVNASQSNGGENNENSGNNNSSGDNVSEGNLDGETIINSGSKGRPDTGKKDGNNGNSGCKDVVNNRKPPSVKEVMECMQRCSLTSELNPVCGTDTITYMNPSRLLCAQFCGVNVKVKKFAPCDSTSVTNVHCLTTCTNPPVTDNPVTVTPPIPSIEACLEACPSSVEFKPVCGTNNVTYRNLEKLQCARRCGLDVSLKKSTHCAAPEVIPSHKDNETLVLECIEQCPVPPLYEPVCGSNGVTYNTTDHLICARRCGIVVEVKELNACFTVPDVTPTPITSTTTEKIQVTKPNNGLNFTIDPDILANIWGTTTAKPNDGDEEFDLDERVQDQQ